MLPCTNVRLSKDLLYTCYLSIYHILIGERVGIKGDSKNSLDRRLKQNSTNDSA